MSESNMCYFCLKSFKNQVKGEEYATPKYATLACGAKENQDAADSGKVFTLSLKAWKN